MRVQKWGYYDHGRLGCDGDDFVKVHVSYENGAFECLERVVDVHIFRQNADRAHLRVGRCGEL
jgi:hypothetical protein